MKKITTILLLFISTLSLSQENKRILEAYILDNHSQQEVSSLKISKKDLLWMINNYLHEIVAFPFFGQCKSIKFS